MHWILANDQILIAFCFKTYNVKSQKQYVCQLKESLQPLALFIMFPYSHRLLIQAGSAFYSTYDEVEGITVEYQRKLIDEEYSKALTAAASNYRAPALRLW